MKRWKYFILMSLLLLILSGCSTNSTELIPLQAPLDMPWGTWKIGGVLYIEHVVDIQDVPQVSEICGNATLDLKENMTFKFCGNSFSVSGEIGLSETEGSDLLLTPDSSGQDSEAGSRNDYQDAKGYLITVLDPETLLFEICFEDGIRKDELPLLLIAEDSENDYIENGKIRPFHHPVHK